MEDGEAVHATEDGKWHDLWDRQWPGGVYYWTVVPVLIWPKEAGSTSVKYVDAETPQDACAAGRIGSFGMVSQTIDAGSNVPYVTGLTAGSKMISAKSSSTVFYGNPVVAWRTALGADDYEVQWSRTTYPFKQVGTSIITAGTSAQLPLGSLPGTWYYRVRGLNLDTPADAHAMAWSQLQKLVIGKPTFHVG